MLIFLDFYFTTHKRQKVYNSFKLPQVMKRSVIPGCELTLGGRGGMALAAQPAASGAGAVSMCKYLTEIRNLHYSIFLLAHNIAMKD